MSQRDLTAARWIKSSRSQTQNACVELARVGTTIGVRDSKNTGPILEFGSAQLAMLIDRLT